MAISFSGGLGSLSSAKHHLHQCEHPTQPHFPSTESALALYLRLCTSLLLLFHSTALLYLAARTALALAAAQSAEQSIYFPFAGVVPLPFLKPVSNLTSKPRTHSAVRRRLRVIHCLASDESLTRRLLNRTTLLRQSLCYGNQSRLHGKTDRRTDSSLHPQLAFFTFTTAAG